MKKKRTEIEIKRYSPEYTVGLTNEQVKQREAQKLLNDTKIKSSTSYFSIIVKNTCTFFNFIWLVIAVALLSVRAYQDLLFLVIIVANTVTAIVQEIRAKMTVQKLSLQTEPDVIVVRDKKEINIKSSKLVLDDIVILSNGDQVPSDCIILNGEIEVNESLLTGESVPVKKSTNDALLSGSFLVSGKCYARVEKIGADNYIQTIAKKAKQFKAPSSNLFKDLNKLIKYIGIAIIPLGIGTFFKEYFKTTSIAEVITNTSGAIVGMIPAGMFLLITIGLSVGVIKLASKKTLVKDIYSIEMLARTDVLCLDKTGTITDATMNVNEVINFSKKQSSFIDEIMGNILNAQKSQNSSSVALNERFPIRQTMEIESLVEFSSARKFSVTTFKNGKTYYLGAPTFTNCKLTKNQEDILKEKTSDGYRVLALVESDKTYNEDEGATGQRLLAYFVIEDHIRPDAIETIKWFKDNNVEIKIISGDDPLTVSKIAQRVNIKGYEKCISLEGLSLQEVEKIANNYTVFGRVSPEQKYVLVKALKKAGHVVAMTGDGVNDTLALKEADCSIAMADGSEVARNISNLVLMDSKFSSLPAVVKEGRQVINNVQNSSVLFLMKTLFTILLCIITLIINQPYPFSPKNITLLGAFVIGVPSFLLTFEPNDKLIQGNFIPQVLKKSIPRMAILLISVIISLYTIPNMTVLEAEAIPMLALTIAGFINLVWLCIKPFTWYRFFIMVLSLILITGAFCIFPKIFTSSSFADISAFNPIVWYSLLGISAGCVLLILGYVYLKNSILKIKKLTANNKKTKATKKR